MVINGREVKFLRTVQANCDIAKICPNEDASQIDKLFEGKYQDSQVQAAKFISILSWGYERNKKFGDPEYEPNPISADEALSLTQEDFSALFSEAIDAYIGEKPTVETKPVKNGKKKAEEKTAE